MYEDLARYLGPATLSSEMPPVLTEWLEDYRMPVFRFSLGAYGWTRVFVFARHLEDALEIVGAWCAEHAPGHLTQPDYKEASEDLFAAGEPIDEENVRAHAEADLTYTESGWFISHEWSVDEINDLTARRILAFRAEDAREASEID